MCAHHVSYDRGQAPPISDLQAFGNFFNGHRRTAGYPLVSPGLVTAGHDSKLITATLDDELVVPSVSAGAYFGLNIVGSQIWNILAGAAARQPGL
jgi:hypothetical protein